MKLASILGWINSRILLTLFYFTLLAVVAIIVKLLRRDLLDRKIKSGASYWKAKEERTHSLEQARHQF